MIEAIKNRKSIRSYSNTPLSYVHISKLKDYLSNESNHFGVLSSTIKLEFIENSNSDDKGKKIGSYGIIRNAYGYIVAICLNNKEQLIDCGYVTENLVLFLTELGIGTCWLGATFTRASLQSNYKLAEDEFIPIVIALGYPKGKEHLIEKIMRKSINADNRLSADKLFYNNSFEEILDNENQIQQLENVRYAPSASNKQPWRIVMEGSKAHLYLANTPNYASKLSYKIQYVDIGIAISHYKMAVGRELNYEILNNPKETPENYEYIITMI